MKIDDFSKQSRRSIVVFSVVFLLIVLFPRIYFQFQTPASVSISESILPKVKDPEVATKKIRDFSYTQKKGQKYALKHSTPPSKFDPNDYSREDWMSLGLSEKQAQTIINFNKYGFRSVEDMQKCFIFQDEAFLSIIQDSLLFPEKGNKNLSEKRIAKKIQLNHTTIDELKTLPGIGDYFASKILDYGNKLGGYYHVNQLLEIYRFDEEKLNQIKPFMQIDKGHIKKMNLNEVDVKVLKSHPYIYNWNLANSLIKIRDQKGKYLTVEEVKESKLMTDEIFAKIAPYLTVEE